MQVDRCFPVGQRKGDVVIHSLTANIGQFGFWRVSTVRALFISLRGECFHAG
jgi:hypothetical protein